MTIDADQLFMLRRAAINDMQHSWSQSSLPGEQMLDLISAAELGLHLAKTDAAARQVNVSLALAVQHSADRETDLRRTIRNLRTRETSLSKTVDALQDELFDAKVTIERLRTTIELLSHGHPDGILSQTTVVHSATATV